MSQNPRETDYLIPPPAYHPNNASYNISYNNNYNNSGNNRFLKWLTSPFTLILIVTFFAYISIREWTTSKSSTGAHSSFNSVFKWRIDSWQLLRSTEMFISPEFHVAAEKRKYNCCLLMIPNTIEIDNSVGLNLTCNLERPQDEFLDPTPVEITINAVNDGAIGDATIILVAAPVFAKGAYKVLWKWTEADLGMNVKEIDGLDVDVKFLSSVFYAKEGED